MVVSSKIETASGTDCFCFQDEDLDKTILELFLNLLLFS